MMNSKFAASTRPDRTASLLGHATLEPNGPVVAGAYGTWTLTYTAGAYGIDEGGTIKIARRFASDWQPPQFDRPADDAYTTVTTTGQARLKVRFDPKAHFRPWMKCLVIDVYDGSLAPGDTITIVYGDTSGGSRGCRAQSFVESGHDWRVMVDPTNACQVSPIHDYPLTPVIAGKAVSIVPLLPAQAVVGSNAKLHLTARDKWGNAADLPDDIELAIQGDAAARLDGQVLTPLQPGMLWVVATWQNRSVRSNPMQVLASPARLNRYWGDLHAQTDATVGTGSEAEYFTFARDIARLDFTSHQGNDFQMTDADWQKLNNTVRQFHKDESFVVFPGYEWSANTPAGGDHNVWYLQEDMPIIRSSAWQIEDHQAADLRAHQPVNRLFDELNQLDTSQVLVGSHVGGRYADITQGFDEKLGPLVEIVSCWGVFEWLLHDAISQGHIVGVMCNSDGHKGRPGSEGPGAGDFGIAGGLTCAIAPAMTRQAIFHALKNRQCYGTTGARIHLDFTIEGHLMGSVLDHPPAQANLKAIAIGAAAIHKIELFQDGQCMQTVTSPAMKSLGTSRRVRIMWQGSRIRGRGRRVTWDGSIKAEGCLIQDASPFSFDSPGDGITSVTPEQLLFHSRTTGDADGVDLTLDQAASGTLTLDTPQGRWTIDLATLGDEPVFQKLGGVDIATTACRLPDDPALGQSPDHLSLTLETAIQPPAGKRSAWWIKATQLDGQMAWSSPIYLDRR